MYLAMTALSQIRSMDIGKSFYINYNEVSELNQLKFAINCTKYEWATYREGKMIIMKFYNLEEL